MERNEVNNFTVLHFSSEISVLHWFIPLVNFSKKDKYGRVPLTHVPIVHVHTHRPVLRVFPLDHQSENFILN